MWSGLPLISLPAMKRMRWASNACHFIPGIRSAYGVSSFWVRSEEVTSVARSEALSQVLSVLDCVVYEERSFDESLWSLTSAGLIQPSNVPLLPPQSQPPSMPSAHDFLLFAAIEYHTFDPWEVQVHSGEPETIVFSTKGLPYNSVIDVSSEESALHIVAAQMVRRPHSQSPLYALAERRGDDERGPYVIHIDRVPLDANVCSIDFHSYAPSASKVSATLRELAGAYYRVAQFIKKHSSSRSNGAIAEQLLAPNRVACISVGQTLWIAILGGVTLDKGRLSVQNLPGEWKIKGVSADEAYATRVARILEVIEPHANKPSFFDLVFSGGLSRRTTYPFLVAGLFGQVIVCYFLTVGTSSGVWTSVALANSLYAGKLTDWHSMFYGKATGWEEPGMKMYVPGSKELMAIATFDRSTPREGRLRPGLFLNIFGLAAAILGAVFQQPTRDALGFRSFTSTPAWVTYTSIAICVMTSLLIATAIILQQLHERTWLDASQAPTRWAVYSTIIASVTVSGLALCLLRFNVVKYWPVLDALTWLSGLPLGMAENGRMFGAADPNTLHLILLNRWVMGAVASAVGSS